MVRAVVAQPKKGEKVDKNKPLPWGCQKEGYIPCNLEGDPETVICVATKEELVNCPINDIKFVRNLYDATKILVQGKTKYYLAAGQVPDNWIVNYAGTWVDKKTGLKVKTSKYRKKSMFIYSKQANQFPINHVKMSQTTPCLDPSQTDTPFDQKYFPSEVSV